jgi:hypothetical protein
MDAGQQGVKLMQRDPVTSSNLAAVGYDPVGQVLEIEFRSGGIYDYYGVPQGLYEQLMAATSLGTFFHRYIRNAFQTVRVG